MIIESIDKIKINRINLDVGGEGADGARVAQQVVTDLSHRQADRPARVALELDDVVRAAELCYSLKCRA